MTWAALAAAMPALLLVGCGGGTSAPYDFSATKACLEAHKGLVNEQSPRDAAMGDRVLPQGIEFVRAAEWAFPFGGSASRSDRGAIVFEETAGDARTAGDAWLEVSKREAARVGGIRMPDLRKYLTVDRNVLVTWGNEKVSAKTRELVLGCLR